MDLRKGWKKDHIEFCYFVLVSYLVCLFSSFFFFFFLKNKAGKGKEADKA